ncbi:MAG: hypothetical protein R2838_20760 [Caldilineaceae bacterium]
MSQTHHISPLVHKLTGALLIAWLTVLSLPPAALHAQTTGAAGSAYRHVMLELDAAAGNADLRRGAQATADQADVLRPRAPSWPP